MLLAPGIVTSAADAFADARLAYVNNAFSTRLYNSVNSSAPVAGTDATGRTTLASFGLCYDNASVVPRARWRASKGSAPVGRFTRAFGNNATEGWHRSMPVGIEVTAGTTATVAAMFILGASSTAEARATAATVGAFVLSVAAIAQATATASTTGTLAAGVTSVAQARATASTTGTLTLGASSIAQALARATAVATFVLGLQSTADSGAAAIVRGVVLAVLTLRQLVTAPLTARPVASALTARPADATLTHRTAVASLLTAQLAVDAARTTRAPDSTLTARPSTDGTLHFESDDPVA